MDAPTENLVETMTGLGATGVELMLAHIAQVPLQGHPMIPLVQVSADPGVKARYGKDLDKALPETENLTPIVTLLEGLVGRTLSGDYQPKLFSRGVTEFQLTRGRLGISL